MSNKGLESRQETWDVFNRQSMTTRDLAEALGVTYRAAQSRVRTLLDSGAIEIDGEQPRPLFEVVFYKTVPGTRPRAKSKDERFAIRRPPPLDIQLKPDGTAPLRVPNSVWQWRSFV